MSKIPHPIIIACLLLLLSFVISISYDSNLLKVKVIGRAEKPLREYCQNEKFPFW